MINLTDIKMYNFCDIEDEHTLYTCDLGCG